MKEFFEQVIKTGQFVLAEMEDRIDKAFVMGKISAEDTVELKELAAEYAKDEKQIDVAAILADLEKRLEVLESAGIRVWVNGMTTAQGQTVLYAILKPEDTTLRYCRYDGGRASTALSPGKIDGWVVLASAGGEVTHRVEHDTDGKIILVPVNQESVED
jgi:hypothetical protein